MPGLGQRLLNRVLVLMGINPQVLIRNVPPAVSVAVRIHQSQIDPSCKIYPPARIGESSIGRYTYVADNSRISMTRIGSFCSIGPDFLCGWGLHPLEAVSTHPMFYSTRRQNGLTLSGSDKVQERLPISIGNDVFIGARVTILDGVTIGDGAVVAAGAVVTSDVAPFAIVGGVPAKFLRFRLPEETVQEMLRIRWWDWDDERLVAVEKSILDPAGFVRTFSSKEL